MEHVTVFCANRTILTNPPSAQNTDLIIKLAGKVKFILEQSHRGGREGGTEDIAVVFRQLQH
jgi:hypothetical protein